MTPMTRMVRWCRRTVRATTTRPLHTRASSGRPSRRRRARPTTGSETPSHRSSSKQRPDSPSGTSIVVKRPSSTRSHRRDFESTPTARVSESDSESPYQGAFEPKARRQRRTSTASSPLPSVKPPDEQKPSKSPKSPYS
eukprot:6582222-Prymnesium_polylepis.1